MKRAAYIEYDTNRQGEVRTGHVERTARYGSPIAVGIVVDYEHRLELSVDRNGRAELVRRRTAERPHEVLWEGSLP